MVDHIMDKVNQIKEVDEIFIVTNDRFFTQFQDWHQSTKQKSSVKIVNDGTKSNEDRLGAMGDLHYTINKKTIKDDVLLIGGDNLFEFSLKDLVELSRKKNASAIALFDIKDKSKCAKKLGVATIDHTNRITSFEEKPEQPKSTLAATLCYILKKESITKLPSFIREGKADNAGSFIAWLIKSEQVYGLPFSERWFDIGSIEALEEASKMYEAQ